MDSTRPPKVSSGIWQPHVSRQQTLLSPVRCQVGPGRSLLRHVPQILGSGSGGNLEAKSTGSGQRICGSSQRIAEIRQYVYRDRPFVYYVKDLEWSLLVSLSLCLYVCLSLSVSLSLSWAPQRMTSPSPTCASWPRPCSCSQRPCGRWCSRAWSTTTACWRSLLPW